MRNRRPTSAGPMGRRQSAIGVLFAAVILLIQDVDRPEAGFLRIDQQPLLDIATTLAGYR